MRGGRRDDRQDVRGAIVAFVEVKSQFRPKDHALKLAFSAIVRCLDVAVLEEQEKTMPLEMEVAKRLPSGVFGGISCGRSITKRSAMIRSPSSAT